LYETESNLVQVKIGHILTIRSLAVSVLAAVLVGALAYPHKGIVLLLAVLIPFYLLEATYDAYLLPIASRETVLRGEIAGILKEAGKGNLAEAYKMQVDHRVTPPTWPPFWRTLHEPSRLGLYSAMILIPITIAYLSGAI
jgi:hypothetical protein